MAAMSDAPLGGEVSSASLLSSNHLVGLTPSSPARSMSPTKGGENATSSSAEECWSATCCDISPANDSEFLIGTEEGKIMKCSKTYHSHYLVAYEVILFCTMLSAEGNVYLNIDILIFFVLQLRDITWQYIRYDTTSSCLLSSYHARQTGPLNYGMKIPQRLYSHSILEALLVRFAGHLTVAQHLQHAQQTDR